MKIGITCYPTMGGSGIIATELGINMAEKGHEVHFITSNTPFRIQMSHPNITIHQVDVNQYSVFQYPPYDITLATKIAEVINSYDLDILHMHYAVPHAICGILAKQISRSDVKIVTTLHGTDITVLGYDSTLKEAIKFGIEDSDVVTSVSDSLKEQTYQIIEPNKEIVTVYNFINEKDFKVGKNLELRRQYGIDDDEKVLMHVSNFRKVKRIEDVIKTFQLVRQEIKSKLVLVGDGPELNEMRCLAKKLGVEKDVLFLGKRSKIQTYYQMADLFLLMSEKESFGLVLLEAMYSGVPCIGTTAGGMKEVIQHQETGYIVEIGDYTSASQFAIQILTDEQLYIKMQSAMLMDIKQRFNSNQISKQYENIYLELLR